MIDLNPVGEDAIRESAMAYAVVLARKIGGRCWNRDQWSFTQDDLISAAYEGYVEAVRRFRPPGDINKYIRAWMRGRVHEVLRQEAKAHGLVRKHQRRCRKCREPMGHTDHLTPEMLYCSLCQEKGAQHDDHEAAQEPMAPAAGEA